MRAARLLAYALVAGLLLSQAPATAAPPASPPGPGCPQPLLDEPAHSSAAVTELGAELSEVEAPAGWSTTRVQRELLTDPSLWVDPCGSLFFVDPQPTGTPAPQAAVAAATSIAPADAFNLHSRPGSLHTIFLDFDGETVTGTQWNTSYGTPSWVAPAWSTDGDATSFSTAERNGIIEVWQRVADDYAPFDVDVTTADPGPEALTFSSGTDQTYGTRALITPDTAAATTLCGNTCGGIAYVNTLTKVGSNLWQPAWVFAHQLSNVPKYIAEAASHEIGHNLSLTHDGLLATSPSGFKEYYVGAGGWGPIMGAPYSQSIIQWSRGEYPFANNAQDDVSLITSAGAPVLSDDVGDTVATAKALTPGTPVDGMITSATDTDWFSFTAGGPLTATVTPLATWPNLDTRLVLTTADGTELASSAPPYDSGTWPSDAAATISGFQLPAPGSYRLEVEGVGNGIPGSDGTTDYGSLGAYRVVVNTSLVVSGPTAAPTWVLGAPVSLQLEAAGGTTPHSWSVTSGSLPPGVSLNGSTISGTPTAAGSWQVTVRVTDATMATASRELTLTVVPPVSIASPPGEVSLTADTQVMLTLLAEGGRTPFTWDLAAGALPPGLTLSGAAISGSPTSAGTWSAQLRVTDALAQTAVRTVGFTVAPRLTVAAPDAVVRLTAGTPASVGLSAAGGQAPYVWSLAAGSLPTGVSLTGSLLAGVPTGTGTWAASLQVRDAAGAMAHKTLEFQVAAGPVPPSARLSLASKTALPTARKKHAYRQQLTATGGSGQLSWSRTSGKLPKGVKLRGTGLLTGKPTTKGKFTFVVKVRDATGRTDTTRCTLRVK